MATKATTAEDRLIEFGIHLPDAPTPFGAYVPAVQTGNLLFLSGMLATSGHTATVVGVVGKATSWLRGSCCFSCVGGTTHCANSSPVVRGR